MNKNSIENHLKSAITQATPNVLDEIMAGNHPQDQVQVVEMRRSYRSRIRLLSTVAAACMALLLFTGGFQVYGTHYRIASTVELDVNPSVVMQANSVDKILSAKAINSDGEGILDGMDLKGIDIKIAVNAVIGSMAQQGYLSDEESSILVSVSGKDNEKADTLRKEVVMNIEASLEANQVNATVFNQQITPNQELEELAQEYDISSGKAGFIQTLVEKDESLTIEELAVLSMSEINKIINEKDIIVDDLIEIPSSSEAEPSLTEDADGAADTEEDEIWQDQDSEEEPPETEVKEEPSEESLENGVDPGNLEETTAGSSEEESPTDEERPERNHQVRITSVQYEDGIVRVDFSGPVSWKNPTVSVRGQEGEFYPAMLLATERDYCEIYVTGLLEDGDYAFTIAGIRSRRASQFDTIMDTFIATAPETTSPDTGASEEETDGDGSISQPSSGDDGDTAEEGSGEYIEDESDDEEESSSEEESSEDIEDESDDEEEPSSEDLTPDEDKTAEEPDESEGIEEDEDWDDEDWEDEDWEDEDERPVIIAIPRISITSLVYQAPDTIELTFSREVDWVNPSFSVVDDKGNAHVVDIIAMGRKGCVLSIDTLEAGYSYTIRIAGIAETNSLNTSEVVSFLTIVN